MFQLNAEGLSAGYSLDTRGFRGSRLERVSMTTRGLLILPRVMDVLKKQKRCGCGSVPQPRGLYRPIVYVFAPSLLSNRHSIAEKPKCAPNGVRPESSV